MFDCNVECLMMKPECLTAKLGRRHKFRIYYGASNKEFEKKILIKFKKLCLHIILLTAYIRIYYRMFGDYFSNRLSFQISPADLCLNTGFFFKPYFFFPQSLEEFKFKRVCFCVLQI